ncbi:MAG: MATE family efflux transporter [Lachnospira sp.]
MKEKTGREYYKDAIIVAWPAVLEAFCCALAGVVDTFMVSTLGSYAVGAIGLTMQPKMLCLSPLLAINIVISSLVARRKGENDRKGANEIFFMGLLLTIIVGTIICVLVFSFSEQIMLISGASQDTLPGATIYFKIVFGMGLICMVSLIISAAQRGVGNTGIVMIANIASNIVNIIGNYLLVGGNFGFPKLGIAGAAWATVIGTVVSCIICVKSISAKDGFISIRYIFEEKIQLVKSAFSNIWNLLGTVLVEQILYRVGFMVAAVIAAYLGTENIAVHQVAMNVLWLSFSFADGLQVAAVTLIGQSLGRKNVEMAKVYGRVCQKMGFVIAMILSCIYLVFGRDIYEIFFDVSEVSAINKGVIIMYMMVGIVVMQIPQVIYMGCLRGAGDVRFTTIVTVISVAIVRPIVSYLLAYPFGFGIYGVWIGVIVDQVIRLSLTMMRFKSGKWTKIVI